jgi:hypothetical protein
MKNKTLIAAFAICLAARTVAQLPFTYKVDSTSFGALQLEGGMTQVRLADIDKDGDLDIVSIGDHGSPFVNTNQHGVTVFFGNGTGTGWSLYQTGDFGYGGCAVGDLNNDGKQDIAYSMHHNYASTDLGDQLIEAAIGDGTGMNWTAWDDGLAGNGESWGMFGTDIGDYDNDGWLDIGSNSFGAGQGIHMYKNNSNGTWTQTYSFGNGNTGKYLQFGDIDGDGALDFVAPNYQGATFFGTGSGSFSLKKFGLPSLPNSSQSPYGDVCLHDIDNDGDDDFAFTYKVNGTAGVYVYKWNRNTQQWDDASTGLPTSTSDSYNLARFADIDMDGYADLLTCSDIGDEFQIYKGNGGTSWTKVAGVVMNKLLGIQDVAIADIDHSGFPDILVCYTYLGGGVFNPTTYNQYRLLLDKMAPSDVKANLLYPNGGECWRSGSVRFINWTSAVPNNNSSAATLEYSSSGPGGPWINIATNVPNNGTYQWTVPASLVSTNCFVRVTVKDNITQNTATSMNAFAFNMGCTASSTGIAAVNAGAINLYPNPLSEAATLSIPPTLIPAGGLKYRVYDTFGKLISESVLVNAETTIARENLATGVYFLELYMQHGTERMKFVVN